MIAPLLDDLLLRGIRRLELELCGCALVDPVAAVELSIRPEIDTAAVAFFKRLDRHADDLRARGPDDLRSINFAWRCAGRDVWLFLASVRDTNTVELLPTLPDDLRALRAVYKALRWLERNGHLEELIDART